MKVIRKGVFAKVGDYVREGWCTEKRCVAPPYIYGIVTKVYPRTPEHYTPEQIAESPIRQVGILSDGKVIRRWGHQMEVISESR